MPNRRRRSKLERWEIALVKAMLMHGSYNDQEILSYFTRPTRSVNHRVISEIRNDTKHAAVNPATNEQLDIFLTTWPETHPETGLSLRGDELLIKAREAMIAAVHIFNSAGLTFRTELFIVTAIIAWTYLLHSRFKDKGIDFRYDRKTPQGVRKHWDLKRCLNYLPCPVPPGVKNNLEFLLELRHEIEHRSTSRVDDAVGAKLQSCCINFNNAIKEFFGPQHGLEKRLSIALQFVSFGIGQKDMLKKLSDVPANVSTFISGFENGLTEEQLADPAYRFRVAFVPITGNHASSVDQAIEFVEPGSEEARTISEIVLKTINKPRHTATRVVDHVKGKGYPKFSMYHHTNLWKQLDARNPAKGYGCKGDYKNTWVWFDNWISRVIEHCQENADQYS